MQAQNDELPRPLLARDARRLDDELLDIEADGAGFHDFVHEGVTPIWPGPSPIRIRARLSRPGARTNRMARVACDSIPIIKDCSPFGKSEM